ncbi:MAG TPA: transcription antitermination factor NusB [bacterium]|uniref:Transcription antitermination protein NusB n=1 Tax=candidate division TA06 bacterium ADurb.Bin417 TaxID=1852828 RepID=A0A1V5MEJ4_UNCT6|nr:MAG: hypothetical protein BWY73_01063 [candidate division TA06 bacterium ADurb.Bin417]HNQ35370.1 transcription antitermination factor NusB [bacterium]HNS47968.1 transcription antitermination factor NusB [bacterium]
MEDEKDGRPAGLSASKRRGGRRLARQMALSVLYQLDFRPELTPAAALDTAAAEAGGDPASKEFALQLVKGVREQVGYFDELIGRYAQNWSLERVATLDRNILRLTLFEMVVGREVPPRVCIDEAVELAKRFGTEDSYRFVNGILNRIKEDLESGRLTSPRKDP